MKMEPIVSSETSAIRTQTPGNYPKKNKLHLEHGESLKIRRYLLHSPFYPTLTSDVLLETTSSKARTLQQSIDIHSHSIAFVFHPNIFLQRNHHTCQLHIVVMLSIVITINAYCFILHPETNILN